MTMHMCPLPYDGVERRTRPREDGPAWTPAQRAVLIAAAVPMPRWAVELANGQTLELSAYNEAGALDRASQFCGVAATRAITMSQYIEEGKARFQAEMDSAGFFVVMAL